MRFKVNAVIVVFSLKGKQIFSFPFEYIWTVPPNSRSKHVLSLESTARMIFELSGNRRAEEMILENKEYRYAVERDIPNGVPGQTPEEGEGHNGYFIVRHDDRVVEQLTEEQSTQPTQ